VTYLARDKGVTQFLDIGTGIPTSPNVHDRRRLRAGHPGGLRRQRPGDLRSRQRAADRHRHPDTSPRPKDLKKIGIYAAVAAKT
jgi:hypothetical protein